MIGIPKLIQEVEDDFQLFNEKLQCMKLTQIFCQIKFLMKECSQQKIFNSIHKYSNKKLALILQFIVRKLSQRRKYQIKDYVGLISLLALALSDQQAFKYPLNFQKQFYSNQFYYAKRIKAFYHNNQSLAMENYKRKMLSTYLYSLCSLCSEKAKNQGINTSKIFTVPFIKVIFKIELPDQFILMKYFKVLILLIQKNRPRNLPYSILLKPLLKYFIGYSSNKTAECAFLFLLNRIIKSKKILQCPIFRVQQISLTQKLKRIISNQNNVQILKQAISLLGKIVESKIESGYKLMNSEQVIGLILKQQKASYKIGNIRTVITSAISSMNDEEKFQLFKKLKVHLSKMEMNSLQTLEYLTRVPNMQILVSLIEDGLLNNMMQLTSKEVLQHSKTHLICEIIDNIVFSSQQINRELAVIIKKQLSPGAQMLTHLKQSRFSFY